MAVTLVTTVGGADSNAYPTIAVADAYLEACLSFFETWDAMDDEEKSARIVSASRAIDRFNYRSPKLDSDQAMRFPVEDQDDTDIIPPEVIAATCEMIMHQYRVQSGATGQASRDIDSVDVDGVVAVEFGRELSQTEEFTTGGNIPSVESLLARWIWSGGRLEIVR